MHSTDTLARYAEDHRSALVGQAERSRIVREATPAKTRRTRRPATKLAGGLAALSAVAVLTVAVRTPGASEHRDPVNARTATSLVAPNGGGRAYRI
jgi:hypothetical protein